MCKHRIAFTGAWLALVIALAVFPGFEACGLAMGLAIVWWPFLLLRPLTGDVVYLQLHPTIAFLVAFLMSGATVGLCAWFADAARLTKWVWVVLLFAIAAGAAAAYGLNDCSFEDWRRLPAISAAMDASEFHFEATRWDYSKDIVIPKTLAGGMWGLYTTAVLSLPYSAAVIILSKTRHAKSQMQPEVRP